MAISQKLMMRQGQSLVMTPQLLQAIKLLQFSSAELTAFLQEEMERNPLLESEGPNDAAEPVAAERAREEASGESVSERVEGDWERESLSTDSGEYAANLGADVSNLYDAEEPSRSRTEAVSAEEAAGLSASSWTGTLGGNGFSDGETPNLEAYVASTKNLRETLEEQLSLACEDPRQRLIGLALIDAIDENGYLRETLEAVAEKLGASLTEAQTALDIVQLFEPSGVGARDLAECLAIQLRERDRFDPAMQIFVANLPLVAKADFAQLSRLCGVDEDDVKDMAAELRALDPKPGRAFGGGDAPAIVADVIVTASGDGSWRIELNTEALPRVLINNSYVTRVSTSAKGDADKSFVTNCLQNANWLVKSLEQRQRTILKVASEIVRLQDGFFEKGVEHLRPLNLRAVADAISMHEFDGFARHLQQIYDDAARALRAQIFLLRVDRRSERSRGAFGGSGALQDQANDRQGKSNRRPVGRRNRRAPQGARHRHRAPHRRQISRQPADPLVRRSAPTEARRSTPAATGLRRGAANSARRLMSGRFAIFPLKTAATRRRKAPETPFARPLTSRTQPSIASGRSARSESAQVRLALLRRRLGRLSRLRQNPGARIGTRQSSMGDAFKGEQKLGRHVMGEV